MYQWSVIELQNYGPMRCIGVYDDFAIALGQAFLEINDTIEYHFDNGYYGSDDYKICALEKLECDAGSYIRLNLSKTQSNDEVSFIYYLLCSEKKGLNDET
jgi:hypothetical protein